jgi:hypothetical protein
MEMLLRDFGPYGIFMCLITVTMEMLLRDFESYGMMCVCVCVCVLL